MVDNKTNHFTVKPQSNTGMAMTEAGGNVNTGLRQTQKSVGVKLINRIPNPPHWISRSTMAKQK